MSKNSPHSFHIPVMGTAFTIDTPIKVARFGISSVVSIGDDELCETMRKFYAKEYQFDYSPIEKTDEDYRAKRITAYLNLLDDIVTHQIQTLKSLSFEDDSNDLHKYFQLLPETSGLKSLYYTMLKTSDLTEKNRLQENLRNNIIPGSIDVNIMTKLDRTNYDKEGKPLPDRDSDALSALRGYAQSKLDSGIVFSAGFNRRLYAYIEQFQDFYPDETGYIKKRIIMKVSDFRSSMTQGKFLAKKGVWITEHRVESGLNCGGHAFASEGFLLGPILEEFKQKRAEMVSSLLVTCNDALTKRNRTIFSNVPETLVTVQGGIGTPTENSFLFSYYNVNKTGWATPFLLVPEATTLDPSTRELLKKAGKEDLYLSEISPLGVPFNTVRDTESEKQKLERFEKGRPGSPCPKAHLVSNTDYSKKPVCTASIFYQRREIERLNKLSLGAEVLKQAVRGVINKSCLCEDLAAPALIENKIENKRPLKSAVCPGPNLAYFSRISSLSDMVGHIYGRLNLLNDTYRSNMFVNELKMYIDYLSKEIKKALDKPTDRQLTYFDNFRRNLLDGIEYYKDLVPKLVEETKRYQEKMSEEIIELKNELDSLTEANKDMFPKVFSRAV